MAVEKLELSQEDLAAMEGAGGYTPEPVQEPIIEEQEVVETQKIEETIEETTEQETTQEEEVAEEPQLIIQEPESIPAQDEQQPEVALTKVKAKAYNNSLVAALNKYVATEVGIDKKKQVEFVRRFYSDYENLSPVEMIRLDVLNDPYNKDLDSDAIEWEIQEKLSKFNLDSDDEKERRIAESHLKREAMIIKDKLTKQDQEFVSKYMTDDLEIEVDAPVAEAKKGPTPEEVQAWREAKTQEYLPEISKFVKNGVISIQDKDGVINIPAIEAQEYVNSLLDPVGFIQSVAINPDGTPNFGKWIQIVTAAKNSLAYQSTMIKHGIALGQQKIAGKIKNEAPLGQGRPVIEGNGPEFVRPQDDINGWVKAAENIRPYIRK